MCNNIFDKYKLDEEIQLKFISLHKLKDKCSHQMSKTSAGLFLKQ